VRAKDVLLWVRNNAGRTALTEAAGLVGDFKSLFDIVGLDLSKVATSAQLPDLGVWGAQLAAVAVRAKEILIWTRNVIGEDVLKEAAGLAEPFKKIMDVINVDLSKAAVNSQLPDLQVWGAQLAMVAIRLKDVLIWTRDQVGADAIKAAGDVAGDYKKVFDILGVNLAQAVPPGANFMAYLTAYLAGLRQAVPPIVAALDGLENDLTGATLEKAAKTTAAIKGVVGVLDLSGALFEVKQFSVDIAAMKAGLTRFIAALGGSVEMLVPALVTIGDKYKEALAKAADVAGKIQTVMDSLAGIVDSLNAADEGGGIDAGLIGDLLAQLNAAGSVIGQAMTPVTTAPAVPVGTRPEPGKSGVTNNGDGSITINLHLELGGNLLETLTQQIQEALGTSQDFYLLAGNEGGLP